MRDAKTGGQIMRKAQFGTIIHGTFRNEDLMQAFVNELEYLDTDKKHAKLIAEANQFIVDAGSSDYYDTDEAAEIAGDLIEAEELLVKLDTPLEVVFHGSYVKHLDSSDLVRIYL